MIELLNGIYCRKEILSHAVGTDIACSTHIARRLIPGVFKEEAVMKGTLSGLPARAQGNARRLESCIKLNAHAVSAIVCEYNIVMAFLYFSFDFLYNNFFIIVVF